MRMVWNSGLNWIALKIVTYKKGMVIKMKQKKCRRLLYVLLASFMLTGCGLQEVPYELTEEEQQLVVSYSAHVVSKFNTYQKDGITHVPNSETEDMPQEENSVPETEQEESNQNTDVSTGEVVENTEESGEVITLENLYADKGLTLTYLGNEVTNSYKESDLYAINASYGKTFLVLKINVANLTEEVVTVDNLSGGDTFSVKYTMSDGKMYHAKAAMTLLLSDFATYEGSIEPQASEDMVIVFEIPEGTTVVENFILKINREGTIFEINL